MSDDGSFADFLADVIEAGSEHPADGGLAECLDSKGYTEAGRRRMVEQLREVARRHRTLP